MKCLTKCIRKYRSIDPERRRFRWNWTVLQLMNSLTGIAFFITVSSLYQFVTSSSTPASDDIQPGLGLSDIWYTVIVSAQSLGELMGAVIMGTLSRWVYTKLITLISLGICFTGALLYGIGKAGWMLLVGRFLIGFYQGSQQANWRSYIGETSVKVIGMLPKEKQAKSTIKYTNFFLAFAVGSFFLAVGPVLGAIASRIPGLDQFRWPGWYLCAHAAVLFLFVSVVFKERWSDIQHGGQRACNFRDISVPYRTMAVLIFSFFVVNLHFSVVDSLENPILSDNFGLDIDTIPLVFIATLVFYTSSNLAIYLFQRCHTDNRVITMIAFVLTVIGCFILVDWQSMGGDPCNQFNNYNISVCPDQSNQYHKVVISEAVVLSKETCNKINLTMESSSYGVVVLSCDLEDPWIRDVYADLYSKNESLSVFCHVESASGHLSSTLNCYWADLGVWLQLHGSLPEEWDYLTEVEWQGSSGSGAEHSLTPFPFTECATTSVVPKTGQTVFFVLLRLEVDLSELCFLECISASPASSCPQPDCVYPDSLTDNCTTNSEENPLCVAESKEVDLLFCTTNSSAIESSCVCEQFGSVPGYNCFWNPISRITGEYCERCQETCLSASYSINFIQLIVGILFFSPGFPMCRITLTSVSSDAMGQASQGALMGIMVASGSLAKFSGPLWGNAAYLGTGRRTWLPLLILGLLQVVVIVLFLVVYRSIKPKQPAVIKANSTTDDTVELLTFEQTVENGGELEDLVPDAKEDSETTDGFTHKELVGGESTDHLV